MATNPDDIELEETCSESPEQYDATLNGREVGYLRLRWGRFTVECPDVGGERVYVHEWPGDDYKGYFDDEERAHHLCKAREAIAKWVDENHGASDGAKPE